MADKYKYSEHIDKIEDCPPANYRSQEATVYRWVHENMSHPNDFLPVGLISPNRISDPAIDSRSKCAGYGLSLYDTLDSARKQYMKVVADHPRRVKKLGAYIAEARLSKTDGVLSRVNENTGHLTLHEFIGVDLQAKFVVKGKAHHDG